MTQDALKEIAETFRNFGDALVDDVRVGPRREVTVIVSPLLWHGPEGKYGEPVAVRFGGIENFTHVADRFRALPSLESEIGFLGPERGAGGRKAGLYRFRFESERRDFAFRFYCSSVTITYAEDGQ